MAIRLHLTDAEAQWLANLVSTNLEKYYNADDFTEMTPKSDNLWDHVSLASAIGDYNDPAREAILNRLLDTGKVGI